MILFGKIVKLFRKNLYLTQVELAERCGITPEYLSKIENGAKTPSVELMKDICKVIDIPLPLVLLLSIDDTSGNLKAGNRYQMKPIVETILSKLFSEGHFDILGIEDSIRKLKSTSKQLRIEKKKVV